MISPHFRARCNIYLGIGCMLRMRTDENHSSRSKLQQEAEDHFMTAQRADPGDHLPEYYLALHFALTRQTPRAVR